MGHLKSEWDIVAMAPSIPITAKLMVTPSVTQLAYFFQMSSTVIGQSWSIAKQLAFDVSHLGNFDQLSTNIYGDQL